MDGNLIVNFSRCKELIFEERRINSRPTNDDVTTIQNAYQ